MIAMIFEHKIDGRHEDAYQRHAALMRELVTSLDGFMSFERFSSATDDDKALALAFFESENAVTSWRNAPEHRRAQRLGRTRYFTEYRLRMATVTRDYSRTDREQAPSDGRAALDEMYEIDPKFFNEDGSLNVELAMAAGRKARGEAAGHSFEVVEKSSEPMRNWFSDLFAFASGRLNTDKSAV